MKYLWWFLSLLLLVQSVLVIFQFSSKWVDEDQALLWYGAEELLRGYLREPRFFGQSYNSMFESYLGSIFMLFGMPRNFALPISTKLIALIPFVLISWSLFRRSFRREGILVLLIPLTLPLTFAALISMPRGFVPGVSLATIAFLLFDRGGKSFLLGSGFLAAFGYSLNPNALPISAFFIIFVLLTRDKQKIGTVLLGTIPALVFHLGAKVFYFYNPDRVVHHAPSLSWDHSIFIDGLAKIPQFLLYFDPFGNGVFPLGFLTVVGVFSLVKREKEVGVLALGSVGVFFLMLGFDKIHDGCESIFQPVARMFLFIPFLLAVMVTRIQFRVSTLFFVLATMLGLTSFSNKMLNFSDQLSAIVSIPECQVGAAPVSKIESECTRIKKLSTEHQVQAVVLGLWMNTRTLAYACDQKLREIGVPVIYPSQERRSWVKRSVSQLNPSRVLLYGYQPNILETIYKLELGDSSVLISEYPRVYLVTFSSPKFSKLYSRLRRYKPES